MKLVSLNIQDWVFVTPCSTAMEMHRHSNNSDNSRVEGQGHLFLPSSLSTSFCNLLTTRSASAARFSAYRRRDHVITVRQTILNQ